MRGINEANILKILSSRYAEDGFVPVSMLLNAIEELNDWKPIDENTPKDCQISLLTEYNTAVVGYFDVRKGCFWANGINRIYKITPKAWQYLPTLPKEEV